MIKILNEIKTGDSKGETKMVKCIQCKGRKYIELDKIGLRVCSCPGCGGTGEVAIEVRTPDGDHEISMRDPEYKEAYEKAEKKTQEEIGIALGTDQSDVQIYKMPDDSPDTTEGYANADDIPTGLASHTIDHPSGDDIPSENDFNEVLDDGNIRIDGDNSDSGGTNSSQPEQPIEHKKKRRARKKVS